MRRFDVYFLQKRAGHGWETLERAQSGSVLVSSIVREFDGQEDAELRVVGGDWNETIGEWEFSQIFFVDRGSIDLHLAEAGDDDGFGDEFGDEDAGQDAAPGARASAAASGPVADRAGDMWSRLDGDAEDDSDTMPTPPPGGSKFVDAIRAARDEADREEAKRGDDDDDLLGDRLTPSEPAPARGPLRSDEPEPEPDASTDDLRSLGFSRNTHGVDEPVGPPPQFRPEPRRRGRAFFMIGTVLISLVLIAGASIALMIIFKVDPAPRYIEMLKEWKGADLMPMREEEEKQGPAGVMPQTAGEVERHAGVAPGLRGRWSYGDCGTEYVEFQDDGFVVASAGRGASVKVPVTETLEDEYTWYIRRSDTLVEHYQKLGDNDIQMIGDTTPIGFTQRTSEVYKRCAG